MTKLLGQTIMEHKSMKGLRVELVRVQEVQDATQFREIEL